MEGHRLGGDDVLERAALDAGEDLAVDRLGVRLAAEDQAAARAAQGLVGGGGDDVGVRHRGGVQPGRDQAGDVGHVHHQGRPDLAGDLGEAVEVEDARVGAGADHQDRAACARGPAAPTSSMSMRLVGLAQAVGDDLEELAGEVDRRAVGEVAAEVEAHGEQRVAGLGQGEVGRHVGLRAGVRLDVGVLGAEELLGPVDGELLDLVHHLAAAVVALARVALGVLVGEGRAGGLQHRRGDEVLAGDELEPVGLAAGLLADEPGDLGVGLGEALGGHHGNAPAGKGAAYRAGRGWQRSRRSRPILSTRRWCRPPSKGWARKAATIAAAQPEPDDPLAQAEHVGVVVGAGHAGLVLGGAVGGADALHLVGGDGHADAGAADEDAEPGAPRGHRLAPPAPRSRGSRRSRPRTGPRSSTSNPASRATRTASARRASPAWSEPAITFSAMEVSLERQRIIPYPAHGGPAPPGRERVQGRVRISFGYRRDRRRSGGVCMDVGRWRTALCPAAAIRCRPSPSPPGGLEARPGHPGPGGPVSSARRAAGDEPPP